MTKRQVTKQQSSKGRMASSYMVGRILVNSKAVVGEEEDSLEGRRRKGVVARMMKQEEERDR
eukprot:6411221-Ditylum_brightwellii.AAC.1